MANNENAADSAQPDADRPASDDIDTGDVAPLPSGTPGQAGVPNKVSEPADPEAANAEDSADEPALLITVEKQAIARRRKMILLASLLAVALVGILIWTSMGRGDSDDESKLAIAPAILFDDLCEKVLADPELSKVHVTEFEVDDSMVEKLAPLELVKTVIFDKGAVTDAAMPTIAALPQLQQLRLRLSPITDEGFRELSKSPTLMFLNLPQCECTSEGIKSLASMPRLRSLRVGSPHLTNESAREIAKIKTLRTIHLIKVPITDEGLKLLAEMPQLESLYLDDSSITEAGWAWLFDHHGNLHVHINQDHHDRDPQKHKHHSD
ncbi:leucine-rich repeat domain-containing protein [Rubripirellula reticaptiva]|uniref:Leucine Rich repeats (2 copies) n=1 Tax=Rubripirellula reticaptiva TaxID=2528013 RepID=A0A5C6EEZ7_9BACT|nr:hypothetical protein [Rubripirellula reticaptiva]TWU47085.1 Leucine Rich repeats (2 copies) [Rubripirellula reticaptiva]